MGDRAIFFRPCILIQSHSALRRRSVNRAHILRQIAGPTDEGADVK